MSDLSTDSNKNLRSGLLMRAAMFVIAAALLAIPAFADTIGGAVVTTNDSCLNFRTGPSLQSPVIEMLPDGTFLLVEEKLDGWYKVACDGQVGYVSADYVNFSQKLEGSYTFDAATNASMVNIRYGGSLTSPIIGTFYTSGTKVTVIGVDGNWLHVKNLYGSGYIRSDLVTYRNVTEDAAPAAVPAAAPASSATTSAVTTTASTAAYSAYSSVGAQVAATAQLYVGYRYTWGGMSPDTGFDCSGFVNYIYKLYGYTLNRVAHDIYTGSGTFVSKDQLQPGDILCFGSGYYVGHVGLYIGNNQMVHASNSRTGVIITDLSNTYYTNTYVGAKRIA